MAIDRYLRVKQVIELTGLSRATIYNLEKAGAFPKKVALGERAVAWQESEIKQWMASRKFIQKTGREAAPGRPPIKSTKSKSPARKEAPIPESHNPVTSLAPNDVPAPPPYDDWGQDGPPLTKEELARLRRQRQLLAAKKNSQPKKTVVTRRRSQVFEITATGVKKR